MTAKKASKRRQKDVPDDRAAGATSQQQGPARHPSNGLLVSDMAAPKGNQFWKARSKHGRDLIFKDPEALREACVEYFEWTDANPLIEDKGDRIGEVKKMRAMTLTGLCLFLDISEQTWRDYRQRKDFIEVTTRAEQIIRTQKFQGAAADLLNANIIARDLGLAEKSVVEADVRTTETDWSKVSKKAKREILAAQKAVDATAGA